MPKFKTHSASKKRFSKNASGKIKRSRAFRRHHAWAKSSGKIRSLRKAAYVHTSQEKNVARVLPYL